MNIIQADIKKTILERVAAGENVAKVASEFDVAKSTVYSWLKTSENLVVLRANIISNYMTLVNDISNSRADIVGILMGIAQDEMIKPGDRIKACDVLLKLIQTGVANLVAVEVAEVKAQIESMGAIENNDN